MVEALGAGSPILAHDNKYNRWVAGQGAMYFSDEAECARLLDDIERGSVDIDSKRLALRKRKAEAFTWDQVHHAYEELLVDVAGG